MVKYGLDRFFIAKYGGRIGAKKMVISLKGSER